MIIIEHKPGELIGYTDDKRKILVFIRKVGEKYEWRSKRRVGYSSSLGYNPLDERPDKPGLIKRLFG